jgi:hypothetical protein
VREDATDLVKGVGVTASPIKELNVISGARCRRISIDTKWSLVHGELDGGIIVW